MPNLPTLHLDGSTLEGGGQLIRIAITLSALTHHCLIITNIRANRPGKKGLKNSHLAAIQFLASVSNSVVEGAELGSTSLSFYPPVTVPSHGDLPLVQIQKEYEICMSTPGSVFLVLQALYPYLLRAGAVASVNGTIRVDATGGTNVSFSPSVDYIRQVLVPNLRRLGLPGLEVELRERGWGTGNRALGNVNFFVQPLASKPDDVGGYGFPKIDLDEFRRGEVTRIDITVLAPDDVISKDGENITVRSFIESETIRELSRRLPELPSSIFQNKQPPSKRGVC